MYGIAQSATRLVTAEIDDTRWTGLVASSDDAGFFHDATWARLLADCYGYRPFALLFMSATGELLAGAPAVELRSMALRRRWIALPFSDHCPPLFRDGRRSDLGAALLAELRARHLERIELRGELPASAGVAMQLRGVRHVLPLTPGPAALLADMSRMHRGSIKRAQTLGVRVLDTTEGGGLDHFVRLHVATRRRLGVPTQPRRFFELLRERVLARGGGFVLTAFLADVPIASGVFLASRRTLLFKFAASDARYWDRRANHLLTWAAITRGCETGFNAFDWGRSDLENEGLRRYKEAFGATELPLVYSTVSVRPAKPRLGRVGGVSTAIIKRSPTWVCQLAGELLYRYAG